MTTNNRKKKGFTLIEMLVVIAIIAILVSIIIPAISDSTTRAAAAANAANLRAMEGVLTAMRLDNPAAFKTWAEQLDPTPIIGADLTASIKWFLNLFGGLGDYLDKEFRTITADSGQLRLPFDLGGEAIDVPTSVKMSYKISETQTLTLEGGTPMSIYINDEIIVCSYAGYTREDFADIADNGKIDRDLSDFGAGGVPGSGAGGGCLG